jgi:hypothetical protein
VVLTRMGDLDAPNTDLLKTVYSCLRRQQYSEFSPSEKDFMDTMREQQGLLQKVVAGETPIQ